MDWGDSNSVREREQGYSGLVHQRAAICWLSIHTWCIDGRRVLIGNAFLDSFSCLIDCKQKNTREERKDGRKNVTVQNIDRIIAIEKSTYLVLTCTWAAAAVGAAGAAHIAAARVRAALTPADPDQKQQQQEAQNHQNNQEPVCEGTRRDV